MAVEVKRKPGNDVIEIWVSAARDDELVIAHILLTELIATLPVDLSVLSYLPHLWLSVMEHPGSSVRVMSTCDFVLFCLFTFARRRNFGEKLKG